MMTDIDKLNERMWAFGKTLTVTSQRCEFCREFLAENEDLIHRICNDCWRIINRKFTIGRWTEEEMSLAKVLTSKRRGSDE